MAPDTARALREGKAREERAYGIGFVRFTDDTPEAPRGTVVLEDGATVWGYPRIGRILALETGLRQHLGEPFWLEEKVDGYNVRIFRTGDRVLALTRGGFVCPFTTDRLPELLDLSVLEREPDLVICAEVAGPGTPYLDSSPPFVKGDVELFVFELMRLGRPGLVPQQEKLSVVARYRLPHPLTEGPLGLADLPRIRSTLRRFDAEGREGAVFKEQGPRNRRVKYVTAAACIQDIRVTSRSLLDLPAEFFAQRLARLALFCEEHGVRPTRELRERLGAAFLDGLAEAVARYRRERKVYHRCRCRFRERRNAELYREHLGRLQGKSVHVAFRGLYPEGGYWVLEFDRISPAMTGALENLTRGGMVFD